MNIINLRVTEEFRRQLHAAAAANEATTQAWVTHTLRSFLAGVDWAKIDASGGGPTPFRWPRDADLVTMPVRVAAEVRAGVHAAAQVAHMTMQALVLRALHDAIERADLPPLAEENPLEILAALAGQKPVKRKAAAKKAPAKEAAPSKQPAKKAPAAKRQTAKKASATRTQRDRQLRGIRSAVLT